MSPWGDAGEGRLTVGGNGARPDPLRPKLPDVPKTPAQLMHERAIQHANDKIDNATDKVRAANHELIDARNERNHEVKKAVGEVLKAGGISSAKVLDEPAQPPQQSAR
jgi:hypothetical protein